VVVALGVNVPALSMTGLSDVAVAASADGSVALEGVGTCKQDASENAAIALQATR
jgi:hypothetical protein